MLDLLEHEELYVMDNFESTLAFKGTSSKSQIECIPLMPNETIQKELDVTEFVAIQASETLDVRYLVNHS